MTVGTYESFFQKRPLFKAGEIPLAEMLSRQNDKALLMHQ